MNHIAEPADATVLAGEVEKFVVSAAFHIDLLASVREAEKSGNTEALQEVTALLDNIRRNFFSTARGGEKFLREPLSETCNRAVLSTNSLMEKGAISKDAGEFLKDRFLSPFFVELESYHATC